MSGLAYALLMFGCADDGSACQRLDAPQQVYSSSVDCEAQVQTALTGDFANRADFPVVEARCVKVPRQAMAKPRATHLLASR